MPTQPLSTRELDICKRFAGYVNNHGGNAAVSKKLGCREEQLRGIETGNVPVSFDLAKRLARAEGLNLLWLNSGEGESFARPAGMGFLETIEGHTRPFSEIADSHLAEFAARAGTDRCAFHLCHALDKAKEALATGEMSEQQETALRDAVAPWL